ncbi:hypothetical protein PENDEC_c026G03666 [Penicillium decumbens]|uniref:Uncharacterized protein n=1 Tax=Penicillium decumbens TaxID=69771 RepID=A0A1V6NZM1_PENDC|nr:hypothetical protein PENDEC_c026G03666 [Penicillium decumbens]
MVDQGRPTVFMNYESIGWPILSAPKVQLSLVITNEPKFLVRP